MNESDPNARIEQPRAAMFVHMPINEHLGVTGVHVVVIILVMAVTMFGVIAVVASRAMSTVPTAVVLALVLAFPFSILLFVTRAARKAASSGLAPTAGDQLEPAIRNALSRIRGLGARDGLKLLVATLRKRGHAGLTLRIGGAADDVLDPFTVLFEPQPLDETASPLILEHIRDAGGAGAKHVDDSAAARKLRRNIMLRGGWFVLIAFGINWVMRAFDAYRERRITFDLVLWTVFMALLVLVSPTAQRRKQWYLVPGGLAIRNRPWLGGAASVRVLPQTESVLCLALVSRTQWRAFVTDGHETVNSVVTAGEAAALIRAWRSPVPPPPAEQLVDLK